MDSYIRTEFVIRRHLEESLDTSPEFLWTMGNG